jgi:hypothetical protein
MARPLSKDPRERMVAALADGASTRAVSARYVSSQHVRITRLTLRTPSSLTTARVESKGGPQDLPYPVLAWPSPHFRERTR